MALAISGFSRVRPQLEPHAVEPAARPVGQQALQRDEVEHLPVPLARQHQPLRLLGRRLGRVEVGGEEGVLAPGQQDVGVVGAAVGLEARRGRRRPSRGRRT